MSVPIHFEYQEICENLTVVALDSRLTDYEVHEMENGKMVTKYPQKTVKDCRNIDGCIYMHLGIVSESVMIDLIEKFQKLKQEKGWKENEKQTIVPDPKFIV